MFFFFFFNDTATTEIYTLSLHDALPIFSKAGTAIAIDLRHQAAARRVADDGCVRADIAADTISPPKQQNNSKVKLYKL